MVTRGAFSEAVSSFLGRISLEEEQLSAIKAVYEHELGGDRAVIIVSALVAILSSSTSVSKDNIGTEECLCERTCSSVH